MRLENHDAQAEEAAVMEGQNTALREARFNALYSLAQELAAHEGISEEQFLKHFQERVRFYQDRLLEIAEDINPNGLAKLTKEIKTKCQNPNRIHHCLRHESAA